MTSDLHALTGAYAVDALDELERARFERHLHECADCYAEVQSLRAAAGELSQVVGSVPPPLVRDRVLAEIQTVRPLAPVSVPVQATPRGARRVPQLVAAAVAAIVLVGGGTYAATQLTPDQPTAPPAAVPLAQRVMNAADTRVQSKSLPSGATVTVYHSHSVNRSIVVTDDLAKAPSGKAYELWYQNAKGAFVAAGLFSDGGNRTVPLQGALDNAEGVGITVEPASGSVHPTSNPIALFDLSKSA